MIEVLKDIALNINDIDKEKYLVALKKYVEENPNNNGEIFYTLLTNSQYLKILMPKLDPTVDITDKHDTVLFKELTLSGAKLKNYNRFVLYYLENNGKITKKQVVNDLYTGKLTMSGTKIYSFLLNLIEPSFEWVNVKSTDLKNGKIQPVTIDRWMIRLFFEKPIEDLISTLKQNNKIPENINPKSINDAISDVIVKLFSNDNVRANLVKIMNELLEDFLKKYPKLDITKAQQLQAFGWVRLRSEKKYKEKPVRFSSFAELLNFSDSLKNQAKKIETTLDFIEEFGKSTDNKVLDAINFISNIPRIRVRNDAKTIKSIENFKKYRYTLKINKSEKQKKIDKETSIVDELKEEVEQFLKNYFKN